MSLLASLLCCAVLEQFTASVGASDVERFSYRTLSVVHTPRGELAAVSQVYFIAPERYREDASMSFGTIVTVRRGDDAWAETPRGIADLSPDQKRRTTERLYRNYLGLAWAVAAGRVEAAAAGGAIVLKVDGLEMRARFDEPTGRLTELTMSGSNVAGEIVSERRVFSQFDAVTGLPKRVDVFHDDALAAEIIIKKWQVNESVDETLFDRPEGVERE